MQLHTGNPATLAARGVPEADLAGASITPESINARYHMQAAGFAS